MFIDFATCLYNYILYINVHHNILIFVLCKKLDFNFQDFDVTSRDIVFKMYIIMQKTSQAVLVHFEIMYNVHVHKGKTSNLTAQAPQLISSDKSSN